MEFTVIELKDISDNQHIKDVLEQYDELCQYQGLVKSSKRKGLFGATKWQEIEDTVPKLNPMALDRLLPDKNKLYDTTERLLIVCTEGEAICGFIGGVVDVTSIMHSSIADGLSSYDSSKYNDIYSSFEGAEETNIPMSWIEILCVSPKNRSRGIGKMLIEYYQEEIKNRHLMAQPDVPYGLIGLDIVGTESGGINISLKKYYEDQGFDFSSESNMQARMFHGAQFAVLPSSY